MKLEIVVVPVSDIDRAKRFYEMLGFRRDIDYTTGQSFRVVQESVFTKSRGIAHGC